MKPRQTWVTVLTTSCSALSFAFQTEKGSALHEAALFGKTDVVQILLAAGERSAALLFHRMPGLGLFLGGFLLAAFEPNVCTSPLFDCKCTNYS